MNMQASSDPYLAYLNGQESALKAKESAIAEREETLMLERAQVAQERKRLNDAREHYRAYQQSIVGAVHEIFEELDNTDVQGSDEPGTRLRVGPMRRAVLEAIASNKTAVDHGHLVFQTGIRNDRVSTVLYQDTKRGFLQRDPDNNVSMTPSGYEFMRQIGWKPAQEVIEEARANSPMITDVRGGSNLTTPALLAHVHPNKRGLG